MKKIFRFFLILTGCLYYGCSQESLPFIDFDEMEQNLEKVRELNTNPDSSLFYLDKIDEKIQKLANQPIPKEQKDSLNRLLIRYYSLKGTAYWQKNNLKEAIPCYTKSLSLSEQYNESELQGIVLNNIGLIFDRDIENQETALLFYNEAIKKLRLTSNKRELATALNNAGTVFRDRKDLVQAESLFTESMMLYQEIDYPLGLSFIYYNLGAIYNYQFQFDKAEEYTYKSLNIRQQINNDQGIAESLMGLGIIYLWRGEYAKGEEYLKKALEIAKKHNLKAAIARAYYMLSFAHEYQKMYKEAMLDLNNYIEYTRDVDKENVAKTLKANQFIYEYEEKEALLNEKNKQEKRLSEIKLIIITSVFILTILLLLAWIHFFRRRKATERLLLEKAISLEVAETERRRIAADLHDDLGARIAGLRISAELLSQQTNIEGVSSEAVKITAKVKSIGERLKEVIWEINIEHDNLEDLLLFIQKQGNLLFEETSIQFSMILPLKIPSININSRNRQNIYFSVKEIFTNIIKHSEASLARCEVFIDKNLTLIISDNGKGFSELPINTGEGLKNLSYRIEQLSGTVYTKSSTESGTKTIITIPLE